MPDLMEAMLDADRPSPNAGAKLRLVPSATGATLHAMHLFIRRCSGVRTRSNWGVPWYAGRPADDPRTFAGAQLF